MVNSYGSAILEIINANKARARGDELLQQELERQSRPNLMAALSGLISGGISSGKLYSPEKGINLAALLSPEALKGAFSGGALPVATGYGGGRDIFLGGLAGTQAAKEVAATTEEEQAKEALGKLVRGTKPRLEEVLPQKVIPLPSKIGQTKIGLEGQIPTELPGIQSQELTDAEKMDILANSPLLSQMFGKSIEKKIFGEGYDPITLFILSQLMGGLGGLTNPKKSTAGTELSEEQEVYDDKGNLWVVKGGKLVRRKGGK